MNSSRKQILSEKEYLNRLRAVISKDYFPDTSEVGSEHDKSSSVTEFVYHHTSEDNASFLEIQIKEGEKRKKQRELLRITERADGDDLVRGARRIGDATASTNSSRKPKTFLLMQTNTDAQEHLMSPPTSTIAKLQQKRQIQRSFNYVHQIRSGINPASTRIRLFNEGSGDRSGESGRRRRIGMKRTEAESTTGLSTSSFLRDHDGSFDANSSLDTVSMTPTLTHREMGLQWVKREGEGFTLSTEDVIGKEHSNMILSDPPMTWGYVIARPVLLDPDSREDGYCDSDTGHQIVRRNVDSPNHLIATTTKRRVETRTTKRKPMLSTRTRRDRSQSHHTSSRSTTGLSARSTATRTIQKQEQDLPRSARNLIRRIRKQKSIKGVFD
jgi:hypothetical protein